MPDDLSQSFLPPPSGDREILLERVKTLFDRPDSGPTLFRSLVDLCPLKRHINPFSIFVYGSVRITTDDLLFVGVIDPYQKNPDLCPESLSELLTSRPHESEPTTLDAGQREFKNILVFREFTKPFHPDSRYHEYSKKKSLYSHLRNRSTNTL